MLGAAHDEPRHDMPRPQPTPKGGRVVAAIPEHTVPPLLQILRFLSHSPASPPFVKVSVRGCRILDETIRW
jgi:hypothetical protein